MARRAARVRKMLAALTISCCALVLGCCALALPALAGAATMTFGSALKLAASRDTANDLSYAGTNVALPGTVFHINHDSADTALWNVQLPDGSSSAPAGGQVVSIGLEGCARSNGPPPLTQIHFQDLAPQQGGAVKVNLTSQAFEIPVCGQGGANVQTVTAYHPDDFCVGQGDYVAFNDEGGFVPSSTGPPPYPSGVPYMVMGAQSGASVDAFVRNDGVGNGATFSPGDSTNHDGFSVNPGEELMLQATLATGSDASMLCPGGTRGREHRPSFPSFTIPTPQHDGMNAYGVVHVSIYCHMSAPCAGEVTLSSRPHGGSQGIELGSAEFTIAAHTTGKAAVHLRALARRLVKHDTDALPMTMTLSGSSAAGTTATVDAPIAVHGALR